MLYGGHPTRVLIVDRPGPARRALASVLTAIHDITVVGAEGDGASARRAVRVLEPDVVVVDDRLLDDCHLADDDRMRLIVVGIDDAPAYAERAAGAHALAWLPKECAGERLADAVHAARRSLSRTPPPDRPPVEPPPAPAPAVAP